MKKAESRTSRRHRSRHKSRSRSRDRKDRDREREREEDRYRTRHDRSKDRERDREYSRRNRSRSRSPKRRSSKSKKSKKSHKSKKYSHYSRSRSRSFSSSSRERSNSQGTLSSRSSYTSKKSSSRLRENITPCSESNSRLCTAISVPPVKDIDLMDHKVQQSLEIIEDDAFTSSLFYSTRNREAPEKSSEKVIINLNSETVTLPKVVECNKNLIEEELFHPKFIGDVEIKIEKWIRKLFNYRQKYGPE